MTNPDTTKMAAQLRAAHRALAWNMLNGRHAQRITIEEAAWRSEMATRHWQRIESGEANPTLYTLVRVAVVLNVGVSELFLALPKR